MFTLKLANGKEASFENASDLSDWYNKEKRAALVSDKSKDKKKDKGSK